MSNPGGMPDLGKLGLSDDFDEDLFASPESGATTQKHTPSSASSAQKTSQSRRAAAENDAATRENALRAELAKIREVNATIENVTASLTKAKSNMDTVHQTVNNASTLLATWTRILSQTEHNQRLILNPAWQGATQDLEDMDNEEVRRRQESERRIAEEQRRREEQARKAEEEERRREAEAQKKAVRGLGRTRSVRGAGSSRAGYTSAGRSVDLGRGPIAMRGTSGIVRGSSTRGRGRGLG